MFNKKIVGVVFLIMIGLGGNYWFGHNAQWYQAPVFKIEEVSEEKITQTESIQHLTGRLLNQQKEKLTVQQAYYFSEANSFKLKAGDTVFLNESLHEVKEVKRDQQLFRLLMAFILLLYTFSSKQFLRNVLIILLNTLIFIVMAKVYITQQAFSLPLSMSLFSLLSVGLTACFISKKNKQRLAIVLSTLGGTFLAWGVALVVLKITHHEGLRYEDMGIVTRPYRAIYYSSLLVGTLGATTDIAVTILATVSELLEKQPNASFATLYKVSRNVGKNILGPMTNVLFFVCLSEVIPMSLLYLENGWTYSMTLSSLFSLELFRALTGGLGIALTIPLSVLVGARLLRGDV